MKSPFPGMDPYLERHWLDVHLSLVVHASSVLNQVLPKDLVARINERTGVYTEDYDAFPHLEPVATIVVSRVSGGPRRSVVEPLKERFIQIVHARDERVFTVIEFLCPTNKNGEGLEKYRAERTERLAAGVNVVEIDLVRSGDWRALLRPHACPSQDVATYRATVWLSGRDSEPDLYPISLREPLPRITIPLRAKDQPVALELQPLIEQAYGNGRYSLTLKYANPPKPPLDPEDAAWADELLKTAGKR